jgi:soluble lytic murein transglycosylase-like protein
VLASALVLDIAGGHVGAQNITGAKGETSTPAVSLMDEVIAIGEHQVARWLVEAVTRAAKETGLDPAYVMALADKESGFDPVIRAKTSSALGLFQFLEETWLQVLSKHVAKHGYEEVAAAIHVVAGRPTVAPEAKDWIMSLRRDPYLSALMACEMAKNASADLAKVTNGSAQDADLYLAHLLGTGGAARMLKLVENNPSQEAYAAFPKAAKANRNLFAAAGARNKATVAQVRARINDMMRSRIERYASLVAR